MTKLTVLNGANPVTAFNSALNDAYDRSKAAGKSREDHFVRELISNQTLLDLNTAAANSYDENINVVRFFGGFLHGRPWASFTAHDNKKNAQHCRRELADALIVFQLTHQDGTGLHKVVRRAACLLMFKTSTATTPSTPSFIPMGNALPNGSDEEQFYLFNQWPDFRLAISSKTALQGKGNYALSIGGKQPTNIGKYATLWSPKLPLPAPWGDCWRYADPKPSTPVNTSIGDLLALMADSDPNTGAQYDPSKPATDWDHLIADLQGYANTHNWLGKRAANPAGLGFLRSAEAVSESMGTLLQHSRSTGGPPFWPHNPWHSELFSGHPDDYQQEADGADEIFPVVFITASHFRPDGEQSLVSVDRRRLSARKAADQLYKLRKGLW